MVSRQTATGCQGGSASDCLAAWLLPVRLRAFVNPHVHRGGCGGCHGRTRGDGGGQAALDIECLDRVYLSAYVPILQSSGQVDAFMTSTWACRSLRPRCSTR